MIDEDGRRYRGVGKCHKTKRAEQAAAQDALDLVHGDDAHRRETAPPAATVPSVVTEEEDEESADDRRRRRRGRRGGRARKRVEGAGRGEPRASEAAAVPAEEPRAPRRRPVLPPAEPEAEPRPRAYEEDEHEEIGRPEGPTEERHIDPFEIEPALESDEPRPCGRGRSARVERAAVESPEPAWTPDEGERAEEQQPPGPEGGADASGRFGRRPGRSRRPR